MMCFRGGRIFSSVDYNNGNCVSACSDNLPILLKFFSKVFVERSEECGGGVSQVSIAGVLASI